VPDRDALSVPSFWTQVDAARHYPHLARACERLFVALGALAPQLPEPSAAVAASTVSRRLGDAASRWWALVPESVLLAETRDAATVAAGATPDLAPDAAAARHAAEELSQELQTLPTGRPAGWRSARSRTSTRSSGCSPLGHDPPPPG
jgi:hypothetical protein